MKDEMKIADVFSKQPAKEEPDEKAEHSAPAPAAPKPVNPSTDVGNYMIQIVSEGRVIKSIIASHATVRIIGIGETFAAVVEG